MLKYNIKFNIYVKTYMLYAIAFEIKRGIFNKTWSDCVALLNQKPPDLNDNYRLSDLNDNYRWQQKVHLVTLKKF